MEKVVLVGGPYDGRSLEVEESRVMIKMPEPFNEKPELIVNQLGVNNQLQNMYLYYRDKRLADGTWQFKLTR